MTGTQKLKSDVQTCDNFIDLRFQHWFAGEWKAESHAAESADDHHHKVMTCLS